MSTTGSSTPVSSNDLAELDSSYNSRDIVEKRLNRLQAAGLIVPQNDGFSTTIRGTAVVKAYCSLRRIFRHAPESMTVS